jgi:hypothetical protein
MVHLRKWLVIDQWLVAALWLVRLQQDHILVQIIG